MSCNNCHNDCNDTCQTTNPCYDDCGCLYPSSFKCVDYTGVSLPNINVSSGMNGDDVLGAINSKVGDLNLASGKVKVDADDVCAAFLLDKVEAGANIALAVVGTGCDRKLQISSTEGGVVPDVNVKVSANDTTSSYLFSKISGGTYTQKTILNAAGNEQVKIDVVPSTLISSDSGNALTTGTDGKLKVTGASPDSVPVAVVAGTGITVAGSGTVFDPIIISANSSIEVKRPCFNGVWNNFSPLPSGNASVTYLSGTPQYRFRHDGTIEFRGTATYKVNFGNTASTRSFSVIMASVSTSCVTLAEQSGTIDLKGLTYIDSSLLGVYGYIIRKSSEKIVIEFQSGFQSATEKTIVVSFDGAVSHPPL